MGDGDTTGGPRGLGPGSLLLRGVNSIWQDLSALVRRFYQSGTENAS